MSHIRDIEELYKLRDYLRILNDKNITRKQLNNILDDLIPKNEKGKKLIGTVVSEVPTKKPAIYLPKFNSIRMSRLDFLNYTKKKAEEFAENTNYDNIEKLNTYYKLYSILCEIEHGYQFLIGKSIISFKYDEVKEGYKNISEILLQDKKILPNPIKNIKNIISNIRYQNNPSNYIIERNAIVESANDISIIAGMQNDNDIAQIFEEYKTATECIGYTSDNKGSMYHTHNDLLLMDKFNKIQKDIQMSEEERLRFGLYIEESTREKLLEKVSNNRFHI